MGNKAVVNMTNWELYVYDDQYSLSGTADNHPSLGKNTYVSRTSSLITYSFENEILTYETRNTIYVCPLKYMSVSPYINVVPRYKEELTGRSGKSDSALDKIIEVAARIAVIWDLEQPRERRRGWPAEDDYTEENADLYKTDYVSHVIAMQEKGQQEIKATEEKVDLELIEIAKQYEDCVYLEISNVSSGSKLAYHIGDFTGVVEPIPHSGMFQDSVLYYNGYTDDGVPLDFRYFPMGRDDVMETYCWSDNIVRAVIKNDCGYAIEFNHEKIEVGEIKVFVNQRG